MKKSYGRIDGVRLLNIKVILDDEKLIYEGEVDNAPQEILNLKYSKIGNMNPMELYVYREENYIGELD